ncbi:MAG TPA: hypothetical protein VE913_10695 [Longimicrobium sp.]|nr:hypothetical protein [Longimicrobium sp.]
MGIPAVELADAPLEIRELVEEAIRTGEVVLTRDGQPVAKIVPLGLLGGIARAPRRPGSARGLIHMADDSDAPLE